MQAPPKFSSFRPKTPITPSRESEELPVHEGGHRHHEHRHSSHRENRSRSRKQSEIGDSVARKPPVAVDLNNVFVVDGRGDPDNERYGTNNKYAIPLYWSTSARRSLGDGEISSKISSHKASPLATLSRQDWHFLAQDAKLVESSFTTGELDRDFLPIRLGKRRRGVLGESPVTAFANQRLDLTLHETNENSSISDTESSSKSETEQENTALERMKNENARLTNRIKKESGDPKAWQDFIDYQDVWISQGYNADEQNTHTTRRNSAPVKLSIYERALSSVGLLDNGREELLIGMMTEAEMVWQSVRLTSQWEKTMQANPKYDLLWIEYLNYIQSKFAEFRLEKCREQYARYLRRNYQGRNFTAYQLLAFLRCTMLLADAGYVGLGLALWQAVLEFNCFRPQLENTTDPLAAFEDFWDSEVPRIGEVDGNGWCNGSRFTSDTVAENRNIRGEGTNAQGDAFETWFMKESNSMMTFNLPRRTIDDATGDDPYNVILFSDIQPILFETSWVNHPGTLVDGFLSFFHLPPLSCNLNCRQCPLSWKDSFLSNEVTTVSVSTKQQDTSSTEFLGPHDLDHLIQQYPTTTYSLFSSHSNPIQIAVELLSNDHRLFISRTLKTLVETYTSWDDLAEYTIAFEMYATSKSAAKKLARFMLKTRSSNLRLYNAYGIVEARMGNREASDKVLSTAIGMSSTLDTEKRLDVIVLWCTWIWESLDQGNTLVALRRLMQIGQDGSSRPEQSTGTVMTVADIHTTEAYLIASITTALTSTRHYHVSHYVQLLALLHYLTPDPSSPSLPSAITSYATSLHRLAAAPPETLELVHQSRAHILSHHMRTSRPYRPTDIRSALEESISLFPSNTIFLSLYRENERRNRADDRVRGVVKEILHNPAQRGTARYKSDRDNIITQSFAVTTEIQRGIIAGSTAHSVRAAFTRATSSRSCRNSATLWTAWLSYECSLLPERHTKESSGKTSSTEYDRATQQKVRIRDVFFQGLRHLPWHKRYAMLAWELRKKGCLGDAETRVVYEGMLERGLRLFSELEEGV